MSFMEDKKARDYFLFIILSIFISIIVIFLVNKKQEDEVKELLLKNNMAIASSLLNEGISKKITINAIKNKTVTSEGKQLLSMIGMTKETSVRFFPQMEQLKIMFIGSFLFQFILQSLLFVGGSIFFLRKREQIYIEAMIQVNHFIDGDFSNHLPRFSEGNLQRLFLSVDKLANALQSKNEEEHKAKEFLKNTISDISHQLKTPLTALQMYNEIILEETDHKDTVKKFSEKTEKALERMGELIHSLLKITRLDAGTIVFEKDYYPMDELIEQAIEDLKTRAEMEQKEIILEGEKETVFCDIHWTKEAIVNIVKNALDHLELGGKVWISWKCLPTMTRLSIQDNGNGIAQEDIYHIFKRFYRSKETLNTQGVGLGLPLAKSIIEGQGGILSVQSTKQVGTVFTIDFLTKM